MVDWKHYSFSIIICALYCSIITDLISDSRQKRITQFICGTLMGILVLRPLSGIELEKMMLHGWDIPNSAAAYISMGEAAANNAQRQYIKDACEAYISSKAKVLGTGIVTSVQLDANMVPVYAEIQGTKDLSVRHQLENILETELGITKENQKWIWNQEDDSS